MGHSPRSCKELDTTEYTHTVHVSPEISKDFDQNVDAWALCHRLDVFFYFFLRAVLGSRQKLEDTEISFLLQPTHMHSLTQYQRPPPESYICDN